MQKSIISDIYRIQILTISIFSVIIFGLLSVLLWNFTVAMYSERLASIARLIEQKLQEHETLFTPQTPDDALIKQVLKPTLEQIIQSYQKDFTVGFYSRISDRVVISTSRNQTLDLSGYTLPFQDPGRKSWSTGKPVFTLLHSPMCQQWIFKCDYPVRIRERIVGHAFANITQHGLMMVLREIGLGIGFMIIIAGVVTWVVGYPTTRKIRQNIQNLLLTEQESQLTFDYEEFRNVADTNRAIYDRLKAAEANLDAEKERLLVTLDSIGEGVIATDICGRVGLINRIAGLLSGYPLSEALEMCLGDILHIKVNLPGEPLEDGAAVLLGTEAAIHLDHAVLLTRLMTERPISLHAAPIFTHDGAKIGTVIVFNDITEKIKTEAELLKSQKLESLGILAGGIAHDFNNILAALLGNLQLTQHRHERGADIRGYLRDMVEITYKASDLTKQLLTFAKGGAPVKKTASLSELVWGTAQFATRGSKVKIEFDPPADLWPVEIDTGQISQVVHNLVLNGMQAMPKGGIIRIFVENIAIGPGLRFKPGHYVKMTIQDFGGGIPMEHMNRIFDPFFSTKKDGTGLGLSTSYAIIKNHHGYIEVTSEEGAGAVFDIYLPAGSTPVADEKPQREAKVSTSGCRILVMDDEEMILKVAGAMLIDYGYRVTLARNGREAVEIYRRALEMEDPFAAVIMDLTIPGGMGGLETLAQLREMDRQVKAVVSSGYANDPIMAEYERYGFCAVVAKPYRFDELVGVLDRVIAQRQYQLKLDLTVGF